MHLLLLRADKLTYLSNILRPFSTQLQNVPIHHFGVKINSIPPLKVAPFWRDNKNYTKFSCNFYFVFGWGKSNGMNEIKRK